MISRLQEEDSDEEVDPDVDDDDDDEIDSAVEASDNAMVDDVIRDLEQDLFGEEMLTREDIHLGCFSLSKVCSSSLFNVILLTWCQSQLTNLGKRIFNSPMLRADLKSCCDQVKIKPVLMI
jgi:hypothetical protein